MTPTDSATFRGAAVKVNAQQKLNMVVETVDYKKRKKRKNVGATILQVVKTRLPLPQPGLFACCALAALHLVMDGAKELTSDVEQDAQDGQETLEHADPDMAMDGMDFVLRACALTQVGDAVSATALGATSQSHEGSGEAAEDEDCALAMQAVTVNAEEEEARRLKDGLEEQGLQREQQPDPTPTIVTAAAAVVTVPLPTTDDPTQPMVRICGL